MKFKIIIQRGQVLALYGLLIPFLLLFVGVGLDLGWYYLNVSRLQNAADAAALAGARALVKENRAFENYYPVQLASNQLPADFDNYENVYKNTFGAVTTGTLYSYKTLEKVADTLKEGRDLAEEYVRKNLLDDDTVDTSATYQNTLNATDGWSTEADSAVKGTVELKYKIVDGKNDVLGPLYYVVSLDEKIKHFLMPGWFEDMDAPVRAVVLLQPHDRGLITPMESLERSMVIDNWEYTKKYLLETGGQISGGKWNHYKAKDGVGVEYANNNPYRTESVVVKPTSRNDDKSSKKSDGQSTAANGNTWYSELKVDSINIDFRADVGVNSMFTTDWDLGSGVASKLSNFSAYTNVSNSYPWKEGNGEDKRVLFNVDFEDSFKTRDPSKRADVLWARIESDPIIRQLQYDGNPVKNYNSVRQVTVNFSSDNTALTSDGKSYAYRPYVLFYTGPENIDYAKDSNGVLIRHSQPVVINFNEDTNAIIYMPESPVVINGNGNKLTGFIIAKCYLSSVTQEEMTSGSTIKLYDGFNTPENFKCDFEKGKDSSEQTVFFHEDDLVDMSYINREHAGENTEIVEINSGDIHIKEASTAPQYILLEYTKADSENEAYKVIENGKHNENKTFGKYVNATYKEKFKAFSGLTDSQIVAVTFPDEDYNETTATYYVENSSEIISDTATTDSNYVKVLIDGNVKYLDKRKLPYVKVRSDKEYFYVNVYDLKLTTSGGKGVRMIDDSYTDKQLDSSYKKTGNITTTDGDVHVNLNDAIYNQYGDSWAIDRTWYSNQRGNWKKDKLEWGKKNGVTYFTSKVETATLPKEPQIIAKYHKITMLDEDGEVLLDDDGKPVVKYVKDDDDDKIEYYTKVQNNDKNSDNYIIVDKKGNMLTKPLTSPDVLDVDTVAENTFVHAQAAAGSSILSDYWNTYTRAPKDPYEIPLDYKPNAEALLEGKYRGNSKSHKEKDYRIPALERVYKAEKSFNLSEDSCYSYFGIEDLWRINYTYLNVDEINQKVYNDETERYNWKVDDMFFTTKRAEWID